MGILNLFTLLIVIFIVNCGDAPPTVATPISVDFIELNLKSVTIQQGSSTTLTATVTVTGNADTTVVWYSSDTSIATVDSSGVVVGKAVGSVQIKAISTVTDTIFSESEITVEALPSVTSVEVISVGGSDTISIAGRTQLRSIVDVISGASESVEWSTNALPSVLTVSATGLVTGVGSGSGMITATSTFDNTKSGSRTITVSLDRMAAEVTSVRIDSPSSSNIEVGGRLTLTATVTEERGASTLLIWSSLDTSIATVNSGIVTGISVGEVTIKATSIVTPEELDSIAIIVNNVPVSVTGLSVIPQVLVGNAISGSPQQLTVTVSPLDHTAGTVTYTSTDTTTASVDGSGLVTFLSQGAIEINVAVGGFIVTVPVTVLREIIPAITSIIIESRLDTIYTYGRQSDPDFSHQIATVDGATDSVVWSSSDSSIATVDSIGFVRGITEGTAIIRVTSVFDATKYAERPILVKHRPELISTQITMAVGETVMAEAIVVPVTATDKAVTWSSSDTLIATVSSSSVITVLSVGTATIRATTKNETATVTVTVIAATGIRASGLGLLAGLIVTETIDATNVLRISVGLNELNSIFAGSFNSSATEGLLYESGGDGLGFTFGYKSGAFIVSLGRGNNIDVQVTGLSENTDYVYTLQILIAPDATSNARVDLWVTEGTTISQITGSPDATVSILGLVKYSGSNAAGYLMSSGKHQYPLAAFQGAASEILFISDVADITLP